MANSFPFLLFYCCVLSFSHILSSSTVHGGEGASWHEVPVSSLLPAKLCSSSPKASDPSKMEVVHRYGPCRSPSNDVRKPSHQQLLTQDQIRVDSIHRQRRASLTAKLSTSDVSIPAETGFSLGTTNYIVTVGLGTPAKQFSVVFDTGSVVSWVQCKPCVRCYEQQDPLYDPTQSSTYRSLSCTSDECFLLGSSPECSPQSTCRYTVDYKDNSTTKGFFVQDTLTLTGSDSLPNFLFGCGNQNEGFIGESAGLIGLGRTAVSLVSQATPKYGSGFSYCLPSNPSSTGYLKLGSDGAPSNVQFTPMLYSNQPVYFLNLIGISVGGQKLPIPPTIFTNAGTVIDSGTVITRLPPSAYSVLRSAFRQQMVNYPTAPPQQILDTCYDFTGYNTVKAPAVALQFSNRATLNIDFSGILYFTSASHACLAFAANGDDGDLGIIGNVQQRTFNVVYDLSNKMIGFGAGGCS